MMKKIIEESGVQIHGEDTSKVSKELEVFYNPVMKLNRDMTILLLKALEYKNLQIGLPLSGSGIRGLRMLRELPSDSIKTIYFNDYMDDFEKILRKNLKLNSLGDDANTEKIIISNRDANSFMLDNRGFDFLDIDPFGTPNPFLDAAVKRLSRRSVLAVTATDTSALAGTYENACKRKYWAKPLRNELKHEIGLRILIRKVQLVGAQFDKALQPVFSYSKDHYMRVFFKASKSKKAVDGILKQHSLFHDAGPLWTGALCDSGLIEEMRGLCSDEKQIRFLTLLGEETNINQLGFYDIHAICKRERLKIPRYDALQEALEMKGYAFSRTHFALTGIKSDISYDGLLSLIKKINEKN